MKKRLFIYYILIILLIVGMATSFIGAYLTDQKGEDKTLTIGEVGVSVVKVYYLDGANEVEYSEATAASRTKKGVYAVNITDPNEIDYITQLRVDFYVSSNVNSYLRVKINDQIVRRTINYQGAVTETALRHDPIYFNVSSSWYKATDSTNPRNTYFYYQQKIKRTTDDPVKISFIIPYLAGEEFNAYGNGHSLELGISYDIVQADYQGPQNNWGFSNPPWGGNW